MIVTSLWLRRKYRYSDEAGATAAQPIPLLGILPILDEDCDDPEQLGSASYSVHQIRVTLRAQAREVGPATYLITSSTSGEGKTSLTMSLGLSLAASKLRTLIIDADLVGRSLSRNLRTTDLEGFSEALKEGTLRNRLRRVADGLTILPAGKLYRSQGCAVSQAAARVLLNEAKKHYDVVLMDTGPLLGSLEAAVLAQEVDGVIFTIARGQQRKLVERALHRLSELGSKVVGMVFNRAKPDDFYSSAYSSTSTSMPSPEERIENQTALVKHRKRLAGFGPLVQAVASGVPIGTDN